MIDESLKNLQFAEVANISKRLYSLYCGDGRGKNSRPAHAALGEPERVLANSKNPTLLSVPFFRDTTIWDTTILSNSKKDYREPELVLSSSKNPTLSWVYHSFGTPPFGWLEMSWMHRRWPNLFLLVLWPTNRRKDDNFFCTLLREGVKKNGKKAVRLTAWVDPSHSWLYNVKEQLVDIELKLKRKISESISAISLSEFSLVA